MITDKQIEAAARAIYNFTPRNKPYDMLLPYRHREYRSQARAALEAAEITARKDALEEAAKVAERHTETCQSCAGVGRRIRSALPTKGE